MGAATFQGNPCKRGHSGIRRVRGRDCVECNKDRARERWNREPGYKDKWLAQRRAAYATEKGRAYQRQRQLLRNYGLTQAAYDAMLQDQGYSCAICGVEAEQVKRGLNVDHDHDTGRVRALLCPECNRGLGCFQDDPKTAEQAAAYLRKHGKI